MEFPERISARITTVIASQVDEFSEEKLAEINYGIAIFVANSYKMLILFILAIFMGVFKYFLVAMLSFGLLRSFASGVHAKREWTCLPASILLFSGIIYLGTAVRLSILAISLLFTLCMSVMLKYSPADTEERPIASIKLRNKLKIMSCVSLLLLYTVSLYYNGTSVSSIITFSALFESVLIIPITYKLSGSVYGVGIHISKKRRYGNE